MELYEITYGRVARIVSDVVPFGTYLKGTIVESLFGWEIGRKCIFGPKFFVVEKEQKKAFLDEVDANQLHLNFS